jgi:antitoxin component of MazEF toxin-antitoxin module
MGGIMPHAIKIGNSLGFIIPKSISQILGIKNNTPLTLDTDGESLIIKPVKSPNKRKAFNKALSDSIKQYDKMLISLTHK